MNFLTKLTGIDDIGSGEVASRPSLISRIGTALAYATVIGLGLAVGLGLAILAALAIFGINC